MDSKLSNIASPAPELEGTLPERGAAKSGSTPRRFPIKYKFLLVMLFVLFLALIVFFFISYRTFAEDKKLFVMDMNLSILKATQSDIRYELANRLEDIQILAPRVYNPRLWQRRANKEGLFFGLDSGLQEEVLSLSYFEVPSDSSVKPKRMKRFINSQLVESEKLPQAKILGLTEVFPLLDRQEAQSEDIRFFNRSFEYKNKQQTSYLPIITILISGRLVGNSNKQMYVVVDLLSDFLRRSLNQSELADVFLLSSKGTLISHPKRKMIVDYAHQKFHHPVLERIQSEVHKRESLELVVDGEPYLVNLGQTGFPGLYVVSQIQKSQAFLALNTLFTRSTFIALVILFATIIISLWFAGQLTRNIYKLDKAAKAIGEGNLELDIGVKSQDEIGSVATSLKWMAEKMKELLAETVAKARMESELETAHLIQSTLLTPPELSSPSFQIDSYYQSASECGGDFWDASLKGNKLTILMGDATGHGAPAALVTAVTKSCFATLTTIYRESPIAPEQILRFLNHIVCHTCKGKLLITMVVAQIDLDSGVLEVANAGHEFPLLMRASSFSSKADSSDKKASRKRLRPESLVARGERLGFEAGTKYQREIFTLEPDDTLMLYTDGIYDAENSIGKAWGERAFQKTFANGAQDEHLGSLKTKIVDNVYNHIQEAELVDDLSFVLFRWLGAKKQRNAA